MNKHPKFDNKSGCYICTCGKFSRTENEHNQHVVGHARKNVSKENLSDEYYKKYYGEEK